MTKPDKPTGRKSAVVHDTWDRDAVKEARRNLKALGRVRRTLNDVAVTGTEAVDDAFLLLHKANPELVDRSTMAASHLVNHQVITELKGTPSLRRLREYTVGDIMQASLATVEVSKTLEAIFDRLKLASEKAEHLEKVLLMLAKAQEAVTEQADGDDPKLLEAAEFNQSAVADVVEDVRAELESLLAEAGPGVAETLSAGITRAAEEAASLAHAARAWGVGQAELSRLPAGERLKLAQHLKGERMAAIADLFGRIENLALSVAAEEVDDLHDEVADVEAGADLSRVVPSEFLGLVHPLTEPVFLARLASEDLLQLTVRGTDEVGRGGIVMCVDTSGSMGIGDRETWAKAVMLVLLHQARVQRREMHVILFGCRQLREFSFTCPEDFTAERIMAAAEGRYGRGTDFEAPMTRAMQLLADEFAQHGRVRADVVFATDAECGVRPEFMAGYLESMHAMKARTWGLLVEGEAVAEGPLHQMSEGRVITVRDLTSGADLRGLLAGVR